jgi:L-threonylcarbamoyladenylate synthase
MDRERRGAPAHGGGEEAETKLNAGRDEIERAVEILRHGGLVAFPTETVYGLGADASNAEAVARLFAVKRRPAEHPVIVHFADAPAAFAWARAVPRAAHELAARFWPGPLTLILKRAAHVGDYITGGQDNVGLRVPAHPVARELLARFGGGLAAPSANRFGRVSPTTAAHVRADLGEDVDLVLEGGPSSVGIESTILDMSGAEPLLLRPGHIAAAALEEVLGERVQQAHGAAVRHPGGLERHYAPRTPARRVASDELNAELAARGARAAVLAFGARDERARQWWQMPDEPDAYAQRLYAALREADAVGADIILIETPPAGEAWNAVRDRVARAST